MQKKTETEIYRKGFLKTVWNIRKNRHHFQSDDFIKSLFLTHYLPPLQEAKEADAETPSSKPESVCGAAKPHVG